MVMIINFIVKASLTRTVLRNFSNSIIDELNRNGYYGIWFIGLINRQRTDILSHTWPEQRGN